MPRPPRLDRYVPGEHPEMYDSKLEHRALVDAGCKVDPGHVAGPIIIENLEPGDWAKLFPNKTRTENDNEPHTTN